MLNKQKIEVEEYFPAVDEDESRTEKEEDEGGGAIQVTKIPPETTKEEIIFFFENHQKSGGGDVEKVEYDKSAHTAVIWFIEDDGMTSWLKL